jgi:lysophospholipid acyltransferase (LPLAT)-like uncharacterized protein
MTVATRLKLALLPALGYGLIRALASTLRLRTVHPERVESLWLTGQNVIIAFWHGRQVMMPLAYRRRRITKEARMEILVSQHRDGELIARILHWFRFGTVRGSTTRGGSRALRQLVRCARAGADLAVTPDGPRGPRCVAQAGAIELAKLSGLPIVPLTFAASKKNCSRVGTGLNCHFHSRAHAFSGANPCGYPGMPIGPTLRRNGWNWKRP